VGNDAMKMSLITFALSSKQIWIEQAPFQLQDPAVPQVADVNRLLLWLTV
jgi:hypothetical protein